MSDEGVTTAAGKAKQAKIVELVIAGTSVNEAAEKVGVSRRHAYRLISDPEARAEIAKAARESAKAAQLVLQRGAEELARSLVAMGTGKMKATPAKVAACRGGLDFVIERATQSFNVNATREPLPSAIAGGARAALEAAIAEAERTQPDCESGANANDPAGLLEPVAQSLPDGAGGGTP